MKSQETEPDSSAARLRFMSYQTGKMVSREQFVTETPERFRHLVPISAHFVSPDSLVSHRPAAVNQAAEQVVAHKVELTLIEGGNEGTVAEAEAEPVAAEPYLDAHLRM